MSKHWLAQRLREAANASSADETFVKFRFGQRGIALNHAPKSSSTFEIMQEVSAGDVLEMLDALERKDDRA